MLFFCVRSVDVFKLNSIQIFLAWCIIYLLLSPILKSGMHHADKENESRKWSDKSLKYCSFIPTFKLRSWQKKSRKQSKTVFNTCYLTKCSVVKYYALVKIIFSVPRENLRFSLYCHQCVNQNIHNFYIHIKVTFYIYIF